MSNFEAIANDDGTLNMVHYGTRFDHWWVGEITCVGGRQVASIYGKKGGAAVIALTGAEIKLLLAARKEAQERG